MDPPGPAILARVAVKGPDLVDPLGLVHAIEIERRDRQDLGGGPVSVLQDLLWIRGLAEKMTLARAGLEAGRQAAGAPAQVPRAKHRGTRREKEKGLRPDRQHFRAV